MNLLASPNRPRRAAEHVVWSVEGKPVTVHLSCDVIRQLQLAASESPTEGGRQMEAGGILLGRAVESTDQRWTVFVDAFVPLECEHVRGPSWTLSRSDKHELGARLLRLSRTGDRDGAKVVGWFRTHTRPGLYLDQHDLRLFQEYFQHPEHVCLLVRPAADGATATAGFFFWEDGDIQRAQCYKPFELPSFSPTSTPEPVAARSESKSSKADFRDNPRTVAPSVAAPRPVRNVDRARAQRLLWIPVALGLIAGIVWTPSPLRRSKSQPAPPAEEGARQRPVFTMPDFPTATPAATATPEAEIPALEATDTRARASAGQPTRKLEVAPVKSTPVAAPRFLVDEKAAPKIAAIQPSSIPALKLETAPLLAAVTVEPPKASAIRRAFGSIPGLGFLKRKKNSSGDFIAAKPVREFRPVSPETLKTEVPVRVRLTLDDQGKIVSADVLGDYVDAKLAEAAVSAAKRWEFEPARANDVPVSTEVVLRFRFAPSSANEI